MRPALRLSLAFALSAFALASPAYALKVATWNLLDYDDSSTPNTITPRQALYRTVTAGLDPDVLVVQELITASAADSFLTDVLNVVEPGQWARGPFIVSSPPTQSCVFFKPAKVNVTSSVALNEGGPREVLLCIVKPVGYLTNPGWFRLYSIHLKAGNPSFTPMDSTTRRIECNNLRNAINSLVSQGPNFVLAGDTNFYSSFEPGYIALTESRSGTNGNAGRGFDVLGSTMASSLWNTNASFALYDTQSPCETCPSYPNLSFSGGGMDDRFDIIFTSYSLADGQGVDRLDYSAYGQDGNHFNTDINGAPTNTAVGQTVADALWGSSDHLPVLTVLQLASRVVAASQIDFQSVIVGALAQRTLSVGDGGVPPVDALDYSFATVPVGFSAPSGSFSVANGSTNSHSIGMDTSAPGTHSGALVLGTDDPDSTSKSVLLSGRVLAHAQPSLDPSSSTLAETIDWGDRPVGSFADTVFAVYDLGFGALEARLELTSAVIAGGSGRFSLVSPSFPTEVAESAAPITVHFDDTGASSDTAYVATVSLAIADQPLPGAATLSPLTVTLRAHVTGTTGVGEVPLTLAFQEPRPNPLSGRCDLGFDLPRAMRADLAIFDLSGRRVKALAQGTQPAGRHIVPWDATDEDGKKVRAGVYFARFDSPGLQRTVRLVVLP